jgi:hypothetical protein
MDIKYTAISKLITLQTFPLFVFFSPPLPLHSKGAGSAHTLEIKPFCMGYEDYYAGFAPGSHPAFRVHENAGRMDRRGGESTFLEVVCDPRGHDMQDLYEATLVVNLPEENEALTYTIKAARV